MAENEYPVNALDNARGNSSAGFGAPVEGYEYDTSSDLPMRTPFDDLIGLPGIDDITDIFGGEDMSGDSSDPFNNFNPNTDGSPFTDSDNSNQASQGGGFDRSSLTNGIDNGVGNTDNGNGNNFLGDAEGNSGSNNQADGNGNWFYGNNNQANGNGNWSFGEGNQINGNGNWNLNEKGGTPFDNLFAGENNPLAGGNPLGVPLDEIGGNNPVLSGGSTTPTPVGDGKTPASAKNPTGDQNVVNGNGNWNFGSENEISGNGNWSFGDDNVIDNGNGNWSLGDNNQVSGNGNRPTGDDNQVSGNSNRVSGNGNDIFGNRFNVDEDDKKVYGNGDRYFEEDKDGNVTLISDESASDPNFTFDYEGVVNSSSDPLLNGGKNSDLGSGEEIVTDVYESLNGVGTGSLPSDSSLDGAAGIFLAGEVPTDVPPEILPVA